MRPNRLYDILSSFTAVEWKGVSDYITAMTKKGSDKHNFWLVLEGNKSKLYRLVTELDYFNKAQSTLFKCDSSSDLKYSYFKKSVSQILKLVDEYLLVQDIRRNRRLYESDKVRIYYNRRLFYHGDFLSNKLTKDLSSNDFISISHCQEMLSLSFARLYSEHPDKMTNASELIRDTYYYLAKYTAQVASLLRMEMYNRTMIKAEEYTEEIDRLSKVIALDEPDKQVDLFSKMFNVLKNDDISDYNDILKVVEKSPPVLDPPIEKALIGLISNFITQGFKKGKHREKLNGLLELIKTGINHGVLLKNGQLPLVRMISIIELAGVINEIEWAIKFNEEYRHLVTSNQHNSVKPYINANLLFYQKDYDGCFTILKDLTFKVVGEEVRRRELLVICAYELYHNKDEEFVKYQLQKYYKWLTTHDTDLNRTDFLGSKNLIKFIKLLLKPSTAQTLQNFMNNTPELRKRTWCNSKMNV